MLNEASKCYDGISSLWEGDDFATNSTKQRMKELTNGAELFCIALPKGNVC